MVDVDRAGGQKVEPPERIGRRKRRRLIWKDLVPRLHQLGCRVTRDTTDHNRWCVDGLGIYWNVDLWTGYVDGVSGNDQTDDVNESLFEHARWRIANRERELADRARKRVLNDNGYAWCNRAKVYLDQVGDRPPIPAGGSFKG
jgi:hypothetical protein